MNDVLDYGTSKDNRFVIHITNEYETEFYTSKNSIIQNDTLTLFL